MESLTLLSLNVGGGRSGSNFTRFRIIQGRRLIPHRVGELNRIVLK